MGSKDSFSKSKFRTVKSSTYFEVYDHLLSSYIGQDVTFLEIGVLGGGSLHMWRDFLGEKAKIIGVDLNPDAKKWEKHGFEIFIGDQADPLFWENLKDSIGAIDVILDDGGHTYLQQISTVVYALDLIRDSGLVIVEDTFTSYQQGFGPAKFSFINWAKLEADKINMRSDLTSEKGAEKFWSIEFYESIVAFHIRPSSKDVGFVIDNGRDHEVILDYRHHDNPVAHAVDKLAYKLSFLDVIPGAQKGYKFLRSIILKLTRQLTDEERKLRGMFDL